ncbi:MAG: helix-turn-helix domain-containing protein [Candidatus Nanohaloarchaea archaeon]
MRIESRDGRSVPVKKLDGGKLEALDSSIRRDIIDLMSERPHYPSEAARKLGISKQRAHYHFKKLLEAGLIQKKNEEDDSESKKNFYKLGAPAFYYDTGYISQTDSVSLEPDISEFFGPASNGKKIDLTVVSGSADPHGPDDVRARDGHLAAEVAGKISEHAKMTAPRVALDTDIARDEAYSQNLLMIGGILTNTATRRFNSAFPARFTGEEFPYRKLGTGENEYSKPEIGVLAYGENPEFGEKRVFMAAGVRSQGTRAAVLAFDDLEEIASAINGRGYVVVKGKDNDSDGFVESYEVVE